MTRKEWGGVFLWVTEIHCLRNGNTALLVIQPLFLLLFSVKYNKNIVGKYIVNYLQWKGYTIHWQRLLGGGATSCRLVFQSMAQKLQNHEFKNKIQECEVQKASYPSEKHHKWTEKWPRPLLLQLLCG